MRRLAVSLLCALVMAAAAQARDTDTVKIDVQAIFTLQSGLDVLVPNFERVYADIEVDPTYIDSSQILYQLETSELGAGDAPALLETSPGCGSPIAICVLAKAGNLAPMVDKPWVRWSIPLVTSLDKYGAALYAFAPTVQLYGVFTNDALFRKLGLKVPQTFSQLLDLCAKAKADGTVAVILDGAAQRNVATLLEDLAVTTLYGKDPRWQGELRAGKATFDGAPGWHQALQMFLDMSNAGCFQPGTSGTATLTAVSEFAQGQGLMFPGISGLKGTIDAARPGFTYSYAPFPSGASGQAPAMLNLNAGFSVNSHASSADQAAAQAFVDFLARPKQSELFATLTGTLTQYDLLHARIPSFMSSAFASVVKQRSYVLVPQARWWNAGVLLAIQQYGIGLLTGQSSIDDVLNAMDSAWRLGPA
jgi:raffinose/stachyose/melibiose transport system substrate-binding protein